MSKNFKIGSIDQFDKNWNNTKEANYIHWCRNSPNNQIRLAFKCHYNLFSSLEKNKKDGKKFIELGAGRGSLSAYYSQNNYKVTLLDSSEEILLRAKRIFSENQLKASYVLGDATKTKLESNSFEVVASIGLLEHFEDPKDLLLESLRITKKGGDIFFYVVPDKITPIQNLFDKLNSIIFLFSKNKKNKKEDVYRNAYDIRFYKKIINKFENVSDFSAYGVYPLPMISPNRDFPFTLNNELTEEIITLIFRIILYFRQLLFRKNPWICSEKNGQAFLLHFRKK